MIILGIDPGYAIVGIAVIESTGNKTKALYYKAIITDAKQAFSERLLSISQQLSQILDHYKPDGIAIESLFFNTNTKTAINVAQARGALVLKCEQYGCSPISLTPLQVKMAVCGYGRATKKQVEYMVMRLLNLKSAPKPDDVCDALAVAIGGIYEIKRNKALAKTNKTYRK
ncbi:MAG: crossover junction endodeoxyribonuclease RuvC [bacterium]